MGPKYIIILCILATFLINEIKAYKYLTSKCKQYNASGYKYTSFFKFKDSKLTDPNTPIELNVGIQAASDGIILLSPKENPGNKDPVYEIVVGSNNNYDTQLRRMKNNDLKESSNTKNILSKSDLRWFYIKIKKGGIVIFEKDDGNTPIIIYKDAVPLDIKYYSFASWHGKTALFLHDCFTSDCEENNFQISAFSIGIVVGIVASALYALFRQFTACPKQKQPRMSTQASPETHTLPCVTMSTERRPEIYFSTSSIASSMPGNACQNAASFVYSTGLENSQTTSETGSSAADARSLLRN